jgi:hypothetical protein
MLDKFLSLDTFITPGLIKPFYYVGLVLVGLSGLFGVLSGLGLLLYSPLTGLTTIITSTIGCALGLLGVRITAELYLAIFRLHDRFVGGHPKDGIPE